MIPVILWSNHDNVSARNQWDAGLLKLMFDGFLWSSDFSFVLVDDIRTKPGATLAVFVVPARHHASPRDVEALNADIDAFDGVVVMLIGDEEAAFPWREIRHDNAKLWVMHPHPVKHADLTGSAFFFGTGYKEDTPDLVAAGGLPPKDLLWSFTGQATHERRKQAVNGLKRSMARAPGLITPTPGFTQGIPRDEYIARLCRSRLAPAPSGPCTPDTFRLYEALEAGCYPMVDEGPEGFPGTYWEMVYGMDHPLHIVNDWDNVGAYVEEQSARWPANANVTHSWWGQQKRGMVKRLDADLRAVGAKALPIGQVTVIITTSPIPTHPDMSLLMETMDSAVRSLPESQVIIACDGVRPEQGHLRDSYNEYVRQVCWNAQREWLDTVVTVASKHVHQAEMIRRSLELVDTELVLVMEHDTPLVTDEPIDWDACLDLVGYGAIDMLRFHHEALILPDHEHLMLDHGTTTMMGVPLRRTVQWSQRPHLARTDYYRRILRDHFPLSGSSFVEDKMHSIVQSNPNAHRIAVYHPTETNIKRSYHTDGRGAEAKFSDLQRFT